MRISGILLLCGLFVSLDGCAAVGLAVVGAGAGVSMGAGVEYTMDGIAYKTYAAPVNNVRFATLKAFDHMGMPVVIDKKTGTGWKLVATAEDRTINIVLESLTPKTTRMRVVADEGKIFFKDRSTENEIIIQTAQMLDTETRTTNARTRSIIERSAAR